MRPKPAVGQRRFEHLDMVRGVAAMLVVIGHVRAMLFFDLHTVTSGRWVALPFYLVTGLGHQAVIVFFALSGFLVGGRALVEIGEGRWDARDYAVHRFARLWTVLIPALIVTAILDSFGRDVLGLAGYANEYRSIMALGPTVDFATSSNVATFIGNIAFLQTIVVQSFGTDVPLWSLANEFWYYCIIPLVWLALVGRYNLIVRAVAAATALAAVLLLPLPLVVLGSIWLCGALAYRIKAWVAGLGKVGAAAYGVAALTGLAAAFAIVLFGRALGNVLPAMLQDGLATDIALGLACAASLPLVCSLPTLGGVYGRVSLWISDISFTLYAVHFPFLFLLWT